MEHVRIPYNSQHHFLNATILFSARPVFIPCCPYLISNILAVKSTFIPWRDAANYRARMRGVWETTANTLLSGTVSARKSARGESNVTPSECTLSAISACKPSRTKSTEPLQ
jgi:hypothetical protein